MVDKSQETTHFGFQTVAKEQKADMVAHVFHSVASKYDVMNDLMSFGIHRLWKRFTIDCSGVRRGQTVLDLAGGTGDLTAKFSRLVGETGKVVLADINESMLKMGTRENYRCYQTHAQSNPFCYSLTCFQGHQLTFRSILCSTFPLSSDGYIPLSISTVHCFRSAAD